MSVVVLPTETYTAGGLLRVRREALARVRARVKANFARGVKIVHGWTGGGNYQSYVVTSSQPFPMPPLPFGLARVGEIVPTMTPFFAATASPAVAGALAKTGMWAVLYASAALGDVEGLGTLKQARGGLGSSCGCDGIRRVGGLGADEIKSAISTGMLVLGAMGAIGLVAAPFVGKRDHSVWISAVAAASIVGVSTALLVRARS